MSLLQKFFLLNKLEHLVAQFLSPLGIKVQNIAAQAGIWYIYHINILVFLGKLMLRIFYPLAPLLALM